MKESEILSQIRKLIGEENLINSCSGSGCRVYLTDMPSERLIVDVDSVFDAHGHKGKRCDRFVLYCKPKDGILIVVLIELKSGDFKAREVFQQLQSSADFISGIIPEDWITECIPILFYGKMPHKAQNIDLRKFEIHFRNKNKPIRRNKCGAPKNLVEVLDRANASP